MKCGNDDGGKDDDE
ncbi:hypothetical protein A2U01_0114824, partial [Trifolium medium]|nr:hypothetical protein [Trifolium medium]